ncbi:MULTISPECIES: hypothetical protein [unclassified Lentimonas]|uniref:hypothetical protein n=1 Tax=unclassified Lentimonas TaxID=2630993 RepID=UPI00138A228F|nr:MULTISPECIES: hypothetical protein [unclassified Lentimonas]
MKTKSKMNPMLMKVILISVVIHIAAAFVAGVITIATIVIQEEAQFEEAPAIEVEEPPKEVKVNIRPQPAPQNAPLRNLRMKQIGNIQVANVDVDLPSMGESFTVSAGLGGVGGGSLLGGTRGSIGMGMSNVNIFGIQSRAERFLFLIDASKEMLEDKKGGLNSYRAIKDEITSMVSHLSAGTLFNVGFYNNGKVALFKPQPVSAGVEVTDELVRWVSPINTDPSKLGIAGASKLPLRALPEHPAHQSMKGYSWGGGSENAYLTQVALEQSVDAVFFITGSHGGFQRIAKPHTPEEKAKWAKVTASKEHQAIVQARKAEQVVMKQKVASKLAQLNKQRAAKGLPPKIIHGDAVSELGLKWTTKAPPRMTPSFLEVGDVKKYFKELSAVLYEDRGGQAPSVNVVLFLAGDEKLKEGHEASLKDYVRFFSGKHRVIRGLNEIQSARSAAVTVN